MISLNSVFALKIVDKMTGILENFRVAEDMPIESDLVTQALDKVPTEISNRINA